MEFQQTKQPMKKVRSNRISLSLWRGKKQPGSTPSFRACVQHSRMDKQTEQWRNQQIWLFADELRDLANVLEQLNVKAGEDDSSPHSSIRVHYIIEYLKANGLDEGLDVLELQEQEVTEFLVDRGIQVRLSLEEECLIFTELMRLAEQQEFSEMAFLVHRQYPMMIA